MARMTRLQIEGFRSIRDPIEIRFLQDIPVVLIGENNAGKSNIIRAVDLLLGEWWPGTHQPEDHEFWGRNPTNGPIKIHASFVEMRGYNQQVNELYWTAHEDAEPEFKCSLQDGAQKFVKKEMRDQCMCFSVSADRRLPYQLSYSSKSTLLSKLMRKFHSKLTEDENRVNRLKEKFGEIRNIFDEVAEFGSFQTELRNQFGDMFGGMSYGLQVDFSAYDPSNFFHSLRMQAVEDETIRTFEELGTGQEQLLALAFAHAYAKAFYGGILLAIEEPEAHLHPLAQEWLAKKISHMCSDGVQLMLTTHSPAFVNLLGLHGCIIVRKTEGATSVSQLTKHKLTDFCLNHGSRSDRTNEDTILPFYEGSATQAVKAGLFAKKVVLVEGMTESLSIPIYLSKVGLDVTKEGIAIIPVMGKGNLAKWWRFFTAFEIPTYIIFDNDPENDEHGNKRKDALFAISVDESEIQAIIDQDMLTVTELYSVFGTDFETIMRTSFEGYQDIEDAAIEELGDSKPLVARFVAERIEREDHQIGWQRIKLLATALRSLSIED
jgi:putative ATP-dependent endonuclease of OLD family